MLGRFFSLIFPLLVASSFLAAETNSTAPTACEQRNCLSEQVSFGNMLTRLFIDNSFTDHSVKQAYPPEQSIYAEYGFMPEHYDFHVSRISGFELSHDTYKYPEPLDFSKLVGQTVVSLGEGDSSLIAELNRRGVKAYGTDYSYTASSLKKLAKKNPAIQEYLHRYFFTDATRADLDVREVLGQKFQADHILAHALLCCLSMEMAQDTIIKSLRLLRPGGTFRAFIVHHYENFYGDPPLSERNFPSIQSLERKFFAQLNQAFARENVKARIYLHSQGIETHLVIVKEP